jgi:hypothetical protein
LQSAAWPNIILDNALQQVGNDEIPDGNQSLYQDIANNMLTAVSKRGLERSYKYR